MDSEIEATESESPDIPDAPLPVGPIDVPLQFDLGTCSAPLEDLRSLQAGYIFDLPGSLAKLITIRVNGVPIAHGELVQIGARPGVRVVEVLGDGKQPA